MKRISYLFIVFVMFFPGRANSQDTDIKLIPAPQNWERKEGTLVLKEVSFVKPEEDKSGLLDKLLKEFEQELSVTGNVKTVPDAKVKIIFEYVNDTAFGREGYKVIIDDNVKIIANAYPGLLYGTRSILQLLSQSKKKNSLPEGVLVDYPEYKIRMLMLDVGRKFIPFNELKDYIRSMAWVKLNELHLHLNDNSFGHYPGYRLESDLYPDLTSKDGFYTWEQIRELQDFGHVYGITITPEIDSPGHSLAFTLVRPDIKSPYLGDKYLDIQNPETYLLLHTIGIHQCQYENQAHQSEVILPKLLTP